MTIAGVALIILAFIGSIVLFAVAWRAFPRPGTWPRAVGEAVPVELTEGSWAIYAEGPNSSPPVEITDSDGHLLELSGFFGEANYEFGKFSGVGVAQVKVPRDGVYLVTTVPGEPVAFSQTFGRSLVTSVISILAAIFGGGATFVGGLVLVIVGRQQSSKYPVGPPPTAPPGMPTKP